MSTASTTRQRSKTEKIDSLNNAKDPIGLPHIYDRVIKAGKNPDRVYFSFFDMAYRYSLTIMMFYWCFFTSPMAFAYYTYKHHILWRGPWVGLALFAFYPIMPVGIALFVFCSKVNDWIQERFFGKKNWMLEGAGRVFFVPPEGMIAAFIWDCFLNQSMYIGQFVLAGSNDDAIQHTWQDIILTKDYWRKALSGVQARLPRELGRWSGDVDSKLEWLYPLGTSDVVVKLQDAYLGIGDSFWNHGVDFHTQKDLEQKMIETYGPGSDFEGKEAMVLELVRPKKALGVHSLDIITMRTPDDKVQVLSVLLWTDCTTDSSHSCEAGYCMDVETETIVSPTNWYSPYFMSQKNDKLGQVIPGTKKAVEQCIRAHASLDEKWLVSVGWDAMVQEGDVAVFFEGNFAGARTPRRIFLSWDIFKAFMTKMFWPFGTGTSARPGRQAYFPPMEKLSISDFFSFGLKSSAGKPKPKKGDKYNKLRDQRARALSM